MTRIFTITAAALIAAPTFAVAQDENMTMLQEKLETALADCELEMDQDGMMELTMAQVSGIVLAANSAGEGEKCQQIESIYRGDM